MNKNLYQVITFILVGGLSLGPWVIALAADAYRWVDEEGKVHYGDQRGAGAAESLKLKASPASDSAYEARQLRQQKLLEIYAEDRKEKQLKATQEKKEKETRKQNCTTAQGQLFSYEHAAYLYKYDKDGNRIILSDQEHAKAHQAAKDAVNQWCK